MQLCQKIIILCSLQHRQFKFDNDLLIHNIGIYGDFLSFQIFDTKYYQTVTVKRTALAVLLRLTIEKKSHVTQLIERLSTNASLHVHIHRLRPTSLMWHNWLIGMLRHTPTIYRQRPELSSGLNPTCSDIEPWILSAPHF